MKHLKLGFLMAFLAIGGQTFAQKKIDFDRYTLPNGLKVILYNDTTVPVVVVSTLYHVGSKDEDTSRTGFAHFFEHLLFEGSENIGRGEFDKYITNSGGANNANTSQDRTFYYDLLPSNQLGLGLWLESERMMHAKIETVGVETQRQVVKEEKRQRYDNQPYASFMMKMFKNLFPTSNYKWTPIGSMDHLDAAQLSEFMDFYKKYYVPNNAVLSIAGNLDIPATKKMIADYFGPIPAGKKIERPAFNEPMLTSEYREVVEDNVQLPAVMIGYRSPAMGTKESYAFQVLSNVLAGGPSSIMQKTLVDKKQESLFVGAFPNEMENAGVFMVLSIANMGKTPEMIEGTIDSILNKVKQNGVTEREFQKVMNQMEAGFVTKNSTVAGIAEALADYETYYGDANLINTELGRIKAITRQDVLDVARKYLNKENRVVLYYVPRKKETANNQSK